MKYRSDFVTNSSSSSFITILTVDFADGAKATYHSEDHSGDFDAQFLSLDHLSPDGEVLESLTCDPYHYIQDAYDGNEGLDFEDLYFAVCGSFDFSFEDASLINIAGKTSAEEIAEAIARPFGLDDEDYTDDDDFDEDDEEEDELSERYAALLGKDFEQISAASRALLAEHITAPDAVAGATLEFVFGGRDEGLANSYDIVERIFGWEHSKEIIDILENPGDEDDRFDCLRDMPVFERVDDDSINALIAFWDECDCSPDTCLVRQTLTADGKISFYFGIDEGDEYIYM